MRQVPRGLEQDSASRMSMTCYVQYDGCKGLVRSCSAKILEKHLIAVPSRTWHFLSRKLFTRFETFYSVLFFLLRYVRYGMFYVKLVSRYGTGLVRTVLIHLLKMK